MIARPPKPHGAWRIFVREWRQIYHNPLLLIMSMVAPLALAALMFGIFSQGIATDLPIGAIDLDGSDLSRTAIRMVDATPDVAITERFGDLHAGREAIVAGRIYGLVMVPENFDRDVRAGHRPELVLFYNSQMMTAGNLVLKGVNTALATLEAGIEQSTRMARGQSSDAALAAIQPIPLDVHALFNPTLNYSFFLLAALLPSILQVIIVTVSAYTVSRDVASWRQLRRLERLCPSPTAYLAGKLAPYSILFLLAHAIGDAILIGAFEMPVRGSLPLLAVASILFVIASQLLGAVLGLVLKPVSNSVAIGTLITAPAFGYMGIGFPMIGMNAFSLGWSALLPGTWYLQARIDQTLRGTPSELGSQAFAALALMVAVLAVLAAASTAVAWYRLGRRTRLATSREARS